ncbi:MAG: phosphoadenosine phosphosulfate reductase family protein, partial [Bacteroidaceae bacterium]|nr:phosphoadenosine phosphosulfate reductase family protein [Bacteroidaceae bacterium]
HKSSSLPLSIWKEKDIWAFIKERNIEIADIYSKGAKRTGCVACGFGCHYKDDTRLRLLYKTYPKYYDMVMKFTNNGVTYREALRKLLALNGLYLPDENPQLELEFTD